MKKRTDRFLAEDKISHDSEQFDYIAELHDYLWRFVRCVFPGASGNLNWYLDGAIEKLETGDIILSRPPEDAGEEDG
jgi:hypothetical protein